MLGFTLRGAGEKGENYFSDEVKTPHVAWCKPYAKGKIRVVVLAPGKSVRRIIELAQRIDLEVVGTVNYDRREATELVKKDWDVCLLSDVNMVGLLPGTRYWILKHAMQGRGLVIIDPDFALNLHHCNEFSTKNLRMRGHNVKACEFPPKGLPVLPEGQEFLLRNFPSTGLKATLEYIEKTKKMKQQFLSSATSWVPVWKKLPEYSDSRKFAEAGLSTYQIGTGRGVNIDAVVEMAEGVEFDFGRTITNYDYALSLVAKAILWAAPEKKRPEIIMHEIEDGLSFRVEEVSSKKLKTILLNRAAEIRPVKVRAVIRREDGVTTDIEGVNCDLPANGLQEVSFALPALSAGAYCLDIFVESGRGREIFGSGGFYVTSDKGIECIELESDFVERGEMLRGKVILQNGEAGDRILVKFVDSYGRIVAKKEAKVTDPAEPVALVFQARPDTTQIVRIQATLLEGNREIAHKERSFTVPRRGRGTFNLTVWDIRRGILGYYGGQRMKSAGVTASYSEFHEGIGLRECAANGLMALPHVTHMCGWRPRPQGKTLETYGGYGKPVTWNNDLARDLEIKWRVDHYLPAKKHGVLAFSLGDETATRYVDASRECQAAYRRYLRRAYGTIEALNKEWGERFKDFEGIELLKSGDAWEKEALKQKKYPRWVDRQLFASENMMMVVRQFGKAFRERLNEPGALCGFDATSLHDHDYLDFDQIMASVNWWCPYVDYVHNNILRSLQPHGFFSATWTGPSPVELCKYWRTIMSGLNGMSYFMLEYDRPGEPNYGFLAPAYNFHPLVQKFLEDMEPIFNGLGDVLVDGVQQNEPVALYYSFESALVGSFKENTPFNTVKRANMEFNRIIHDLGLEFKYVTGKQVANGILGKGNYELLILPCVQALNRKQAGFIRQFVENGGLLVADMRPGIYDEHGKPISPGLLNEVFGVRRRPDGQPKSVPLQFTARIGPQEIQVSLGNTTVDTGYEPVKARPMGYAEGTPIFFVNPLGKGHAILLNFNLASQASPYARHRLLQDLITLAGVRPALTVRDDNSRPLLESRTMRWKIGEGEIVGIILYPLRRKPVNGVTSVKVALPTSAHVYDIREGGRYLGQITEVMLKMETLQPKFLAVLPYRLKGLEVKPTLSRIKQGEHLKVQIVLNGFPAKGMVCHPLHIEAISPDEESAACFERKTLIRRGKGEITFLVAFNEKIGKWKFRCRDILSGQIADAYFEVMPK